MKRVLALDIYIYSKERKGGVGNEALADFPRPEVSFSDPVLADRWAGPTVINSDHE